jgi:hypothetical protein
MIHTAASFVEKQAAFEAALATCRAIEKEPNSTESRTLRWVFRFKQDNTTEYLNQLAALGAVILVENPEKKDQILYIANLTQLDQQRQATKDDLAAFQDRVKFTDTRKESVAGVAKELKLKFTPTSFWAYFATAIENEMAQKEKNYRNRRVDDIEETIFRVITVRGKCEIVVIDQTIRK